jgi:integrase
MDIDLLHSKLTIRFALKDVSGHLIAGPTKTHERRTLSIPDRLRRPLADQLATPGVKVRSVRRAPNTPPPTSPGAGYPIISPTGVLGWTDDPADPHRLIFTTRSGGPIRHNLFYGKVYRPTVRKLWPEPHRLNGLRFHDLRHTNASLMLSANGGNLAQSQKRLGHSCITTTFNRYAHLLPGADQDISTALNAMFDAPEPTNVVELPQSEAGA